MLRVRTLLRSAALAAVAAMVLALPWSAPSSVPSAVPGASSAAAQEEDPVTLRLDGTEDRTSAYRIHLRTHVVPPPEMGMETTAETTMWMRRSVESAEGDTLRVAVRVDSFEVDLESENEQVRSQLERMEEESRESVLGETFRVAVTRRGEVVDMDGVDAGGAAQQIDRTVRELTFATLPADPVSVGDSWSATRRAAAASFGIPVDGEVVTETTSTLSRILDRGGSRVAEIEVEAAFGFRADSAAAPAASVDMRGSGARTIRFDVDEGRLLSSSGAEDFTVHLSVPGQGSFSLQADNESSAELVED